MSGGDWSGGGDGGGDWGGGGGGGGDWGGGGGDSFTEVTSTGWFSRVGGAFLAVPIGILMALASFVLLFWNEGRAVRTEKGLAEGESAVVSVESDRVDAANEGRLVHLGGEATTSETLQDPQFGVSATALRLRRIVRMYQWQEKKETTTRRHAGGREDRVTTYSYSKQWADHPIASSGFHRRDGHENPEDWPFRGQSWQAGTVTLGAFRLSPELVGKIGGDEALAVGEAERERLPVDLKGSISVDSGRFYRGGDPSNPQVGDLAITFEVVRPRAISLLAAQAGDSFRPYPTEAGVEIERVQLGRVSAAEMFAKAEAENSLLTWVLRLVGFVVMGVGFLLVLGPLPTLADVIPFLGDIVGFGVGFLAFSLAAVLSLSTIAIAWIAYRPLIGLAFLAVAGLILYGLNRLADGRRRAMPPGRPA